ncbi:MAG: HD domain-containing protein [Thermoplasmatota archaeon]
MKKVRDPIHNYIALDDGALALVDTPRVQRLRRVRQLGTANLVYPGANHTRFEHALGAYHLADLAVRALELPRDEAADVKYAALLHDVGHGPYSHLTDRIYEDYLGKSHVGVGQDAARNGTLREILESHGASPERVADVLGGRGRLGGLVSSDLDVDRMDYLVRDSHYTGVDIAVDLARLVAEFALLPDGLVLREPGVPAAQMLLVTRFQMYTSVYYHHASRVAERMLERALRLAIEAGEIAAKDLPNMDDVAMLYALRHSKTDAWRLALGVDQRRLLKVAFETGLGGLEESRARAFASDVRAAADVEAKLADAIGAPRTDVILDAPPLAGTRTPEARILHGDGRIERLADMSELVTALASAEEDHWRFRVLGPATKRAELGRAAAKMFASA